MLTISSSPHHHSRNKTATLMRMVILACIPGIATQYYFFGGGNLIHIAIAAVVALCAEALILSLRNMPVRKNLLDGSALLTAILLGICLPPLAPWWITVIGSAFAIIVVKQLYGGLGSNPFNPAMAAYVLLLVSFPLQMTLWLPAGSLQAFSLHLTDFISLIFNGLTTEGYSAHQLRMDIDGLSMATPLDTLRTDLTLGLTVSESMSKPLFGHYGGLGWEAINLGFLVGGLWLIKTKVINWHIPFATLSGLFIFALIGLMIDADQAPPVSFHLFSGATMLGAFFIATDPVSAAASDKGRLIYGFTIGGLVYIIRAWGAYPDAFAFAVLLANMAVPLIDQLTQPRVYGHGKRENP